MDSYFCGGMVGITTPRGKVRQLSVVFDVSFPKQFSQGSRIIRFLAIPGNYRMPWGFCQGSSNGEPEEMRCMQIPARAHAGA